MENLFCLTDILVEIYLLADCNERETVFSTI